MAASQLDPNFAQMLTSLGGGRGPNPNDGKGPNPDTWRQPTPTVTPRLGTIYGGGDGGNGGGDVSSIMSAIRSRDYGTLQSALAPYRDVGNGPYEQLQKYLQGVAYQHGGSASLDYQGQNPGAALWPWLDEAASRLNQANAWFAGGNGGGGGAGAGGSGGGERSGGWVNSPTSNPTINPISEVQLSGMNPIITAAFRHLFPGDFGQQQIDAFGLKRPQQLYHVQNGQILSDPLDWWQPNARI